MRKIGELKGKPIVEGNPNEIKNNQIHYKEVDSKVTLSERQNTELVNITGGSGDTSNQDTSNARIIKEYYYLDYIKILSSGDEIVTTIADIINYVFNKNEGTSSCTKIIYKILVGEESYVYIDTLSPYASGFSDDVKIAIGKYEPIGHIGSGVDITGVYTDIKKTIANVLEISNESIDEIFNEYSISEEEFWKDDVIE